MHTGWVRWGEGKYSTPSGKFQTLVNKNAIKPKIGGPPPPQAIFPESLDPPPPPLGILAKNSRYHLPWIFNPCASMCNLYKNLQKWDYSEWGLKKNSVYFFITYYFLIILISTISNRTILFFATTVRLIFVTLTCDKAHKAIKAKSEMFILKSFENRTDENRNNEKLYRSCAKFLEVKC